MSHTITIFGASGDLTRRKLIPALYRLFRKDRLPDSTHIVGISRRKVTSQAWRDQLGQSTSDFVADQFDSDSWRQFASNVHYHPGDVTQPDDFRSLATFLHQLEGDRPAARLYYLATSPSLYEPAVAGLGQAGLADQSLGARRVVIEKPFGTDLPSARQLNEHVHDVFGEPQIYRIDHYLGKETVQNLLVLRFGRTKYGDRAGY